MDRREFLALGAVAVSAGCGRTGPAALESRIWGRQGTRDGAFIRPRAIAVRGEEVYVIDTTGRLQVFDTAGALLRLWEMPAYENGTPTAIAFAADGRVVVPDTHYSRVLEYSAEGELLSEWGSYGSGPGEFIYPTGLDLGPEGTYYFSEYGQDAERMHVFGADRQFLRQWGSLGPDPGQFSRAMAIARGTDGTLFVADTTNHRIQCFDEQGTLLRVISKAGTAPGDLKFPHDIGLGPDGDVYAAEYGNHRISRFKADGTFVRVYGGPGRGPGAFNGPRGVAVGQDNAVYVADTDNHRIQRFDAG